MRRRGERGPEAASSGAGSSPRSNASRAACMCCWCCCCAGVPHGAVVAQTMLDEFALGSPAEGTEAVDSRMFRMYIPEYPMYTRAPKRDWHARLKRSNGPSRGSRQPGRSARWAGYRARKRRHGPCAGDEGGLARHAGGSSAWNALTALAGAGGHASNRGVGPLNARKNRQTHATRGFRLRQPNRNTAFLRSEPKITFCNF